MLSKRYAAARAALISMARANCNVAPGKPTLATTGDTTYLTAVDSQGNMVSLIQSNYGLWGSGVVVDGGGFALHNRGALFTLEAKHPNVLAPRKRPLHTIIPALMERGDVRIAFGIMGGFNQAQAHAQFVSNVVDHGMNIQAAMEATRFNMPRFSGCGVYIEGRVAPAVLDGLTRLGHQIQPLGDFSDAVGGGQAVMRDFKAAVNYGASDPRKDGQAIAEMPALR
jgi:gamma-glutamyltranspeptidase/glutathione hydrolase